MHLGLDILTRHLRLDKCGAVANSRLAMLGVFAALIAEKTTGLNVFQQWSAAPLPIIGFFALWTLASRCVSYYLLHSLTLPLPWNSATAQDVLGFHPAK